MEYNVDYDQENDYLIASYEGVLNFETMKEYVREIVSTAQECNCKRLLNDLRKVRITGATMAIFNTPEAMEIEGMDGSWKRAVVVDEQYRQDFRFYENVAVNRGHRIKVFTEFDDAIIWLKE
jgi:hypothetical protein